jgi:hypothetical protein
MNAQKIIKAILFACMLLFGSYMSMAVIHHTYMSIEKAYRYGIVNLKINANGSGHTGNCIDLEILNMRKDSCFCSIEAGRRRKSRDSSVQDILVTEVQEIALAGRERKSLKIFGFCCQADHSSPYESARYDVGKLSSGPLLALAQFLSRHKYPIDAVQFSVWTVSDNNQISSVTTNCMDSIQTLLDTLAKIKHVERPSYRAIYTKNTQPTLTGDVKRVFTGDPNMFYCDVRYYLANNAIVAICIYDASGTKLVTYYERPANPETYIIPVSVNVKGWHHGRYSICVLTDDKMIVRKEFQL